MNPKEYLTNLFQKAIAMLSPEKIVMSSVRCNNSGLEIAGREIDMNDHPLYILAVGKAAIPMTKGLLNVVKENVTGLLIISPEDVDVPVELRQKTLNGSHPVPDKNSLNAGKRASEFFDQIPSDAIVLTLISGGTSSLMCLPADGISIDDLNETFHLLNNSGANIRQINAVRKHCSQIKGGQFLRFLDPSVTLIDMVISDVPDDDLSVIGSGPTTVDSSDYSDARQVLQEYDLWDKVPETVRNHIKRGLEGTISGTVKKGKDPIKKHHSSVISSARKLAEKMADVAERDGYTVWIAEHAYNRDVKEVSKIVTQMARAVADGIADIATPAVLVFYGESTVSVTGSGKGGRNQELALRSALDISGYDRITLLSAGSDGIDGPTDAAGAIVDGETISRAKKQGLDPDVYLQENDSYNFHSRAGTLLKTGPTGNNLMDVVLVFVK